VLSTFECTFEIPGSAATLYINSRAFETFRIDSGWLLVSSISMTPAKAEALRADLAAVLRPLLQPATELDLRVEAGAFPSVTHVSGMFFLASFDKAMLTTMWDEVTRSVRRWLADA
jgi:hypothetical protein